MATQTTQRSLAKLRKEGYICHIAEKWNQFGGIRQDMFGFIDILAIRPGEIVGIQTTSESNVASHIKKIIGHKNFLAVRDSGMKIYLHSWQRVKRKDKRDIIKFREIKICQ